MISEQRFVQAKRLGELSRATGRPETGAWLIGTLIHLYVRLDVDYDTQFPSTAENATRYARVVGEAAGAVYDEATRKRFNGELLECQGLTIHAAIPEEGDYAERAKEFAAAVHSRLNEKLSNFRSAVQGWRMTTDVGRTLVLAGPDVHDDNSYVSLGNAANRPAKHMYQQLFGIEREDNRALKREYLGLRIPSCDDWEHIDLKKLPVPQIHLSESYGYQEREDPRVRLLNAAALHKRGKPITADAEPIPSPGQPGSPSCDDPNPYFGWVMRADLDGFTQRVEDCDDDGSALAALAREFLELMATVERFVQNGREPMVQLPWAGDNATVAVVTMSKQDYEEARPERLVNHFLDFNDETNQATRLNGWAFAICGGDVHGNAKGNVFIGGVEFGPVRFLVGAGTAFNRSLQVFSKIKPDAGKADVLPEDAAVMRGDYRKCFSQAENANGEQSTLFKEAALKELNTARDQHDTDNRQVNITTGPRIREPVQMKLSFPRLDGRGGSVDQAAWCFCS